MNIFRSIPILVCAAILLSGCVEATPPQPDPAMIKLQESCRSGDTQACGIIVQAQQQQQANRLAAMAAMPRPAPYQMPNFPQLQPPPRAQITRCNQTFGQINCTTY